MKENNGRGARRLLGRKLAAVGVFFGVVWGTLFVILESRRSRKTNNPPPPRSTSATNNSNHMAIVPNTNRINQDQRARMHRIAQDSAPLLFGHDNAVSHPSDWVALLLGAHVHLIDLVVDAHELDQFLKSEKHQHRRRNMDTNPPPHEQQNQKQNQQYAGIYGVFCQLDWGLHKRDPSSYPMFRDIVQNSKECPGSTIRRVDIRLLAQQARLYDAAQVTTGVGTDDVEEQEEEEKEEGDGDDQPYREDSNRHVHPRHNKKDDEEEEERDPEDSTDADRRRLSLRKQQRPERNSNPNIPMDLHSTKVLPLTGAVFHESRCGSTLTANVLAAVDPAAHRVYSESGPPLMAMHSVCGEDDSSRCLPDTAAAVLRDVVYLMSRTNDLAEDRVFFKIQSAGSRHLPVFTKAFPNTPYLFVYRDPVQVMMSHLKQGVRSANCVQQRRSPPASVIHTVAQYTPHRSVRDLSAEEYCAAHLASITETMVAKMSIPPGIPINYAVLNDALTGRVLPDWLGIPRLTAAQLIKVQSVAAIYSKNRGGHRVEGTFQSDSAAKEDKASDLVRTAAQTYLVPSFRKLEKLAATMHTNKNKEDQQEPDYTTTNNHR